MKIWKRARKLILESKKKISNQAQSKNKTKDAKIKPKPEAQTKNKTMPAEKKLEQETQSKTQTTAEKKPKSKNQSKTESPNTPESISLESIKNELIGIDDAVFKDYQTKEGVITVIYKDKKVYNFSSINPVFQVFWTKRLIH